MKGQRQAKLQLNSTVWKSVVSGGTDKITCRLLHSNAVDVLPQFTPFILANDIPEFDNPADSGVQTRTVSVEMDRNAVLDRLPMGPTSSRETPSYGNA